MEDVTRKCEWCGKEFSPVRPNGYPQQRFCCVQCKEKARNRRRRPHANEWKNEERECIACKKKFYPNTKGQKFCCTSCKGKYKYLIGTCSTESQYKNISGNWNLYMGRLMNIHGRKQSPRSNGITKEYLLDLLKKQNGRCALSGVKMTCILEKGIVHYTNASIDRIVPACEGGKYEKGNIQLVCKAVNQWKGIMENDEFIDWCKKIARYNEERG